MNKLYFSIIIPFTLISCTGKQKLQQPETTFYQDSNGFSVMTKFEYYSKDSIIKEETILGFLNTYTYDDSVSFDSISAFVRISKDSVYGWSIKKYGRNQLGYLQLDYTTIKISTAH